MMERKSESFSDETIRRFLLGHLDSHEQGVLQHALITTDELAERVRLAEFELSDDYAANRLSAPERSMFNGRFMLTTERQRKVHVSQALQNTFAVATSARDPLGQRIINALDFRRAAWKYASATLILLMLLATALLVTKERSKIAFVPSFPKHATPRPSATTKPVDSHHGPNSSAPVHTEESPALPVHESLTIDAVLSSRTL